MFQPPGLHKAPQIYWQVCEFVLHFFCFADMDMAEVESNKRKGHSSAEPLHSSDDEVSSGNKSDSSEGKSL